MRWNLTSTKTALRPISSSSRSFPPRFGYKYGILCSLDLEHSVQDFPLPLTKAGGISLMYIAEADTFRHLPRIEREEAHRIYTLKRAGLRRKPYIWVDPINDFVHWPRYDGDHIGSCFIHQWEVAKVQQLVLRAVWVHPGDNSYRPYALGGWWGSLFDIVPSIWKFEDLRTVIIVIHNEYCWGVVEEGGHFVKSDLLGTKEKAEGEKIQEYLEAEITTLKMDHLDRKVPIVRVVGYEVNGARCCDLR